jgi:phosphoglycerate dehydrogenase-like enzyme
MKVVVSNNAFSKNAFLVSKLKSHFPDATINTLGKRYVGVELIEYFKEADAAIVGLEIITPELLDSLPNLKIVAKYGVGLDNIDLEACKERNVVVGWTPGVNKRSVAEMTLGFMLALLRNLNITSNQLKNGNWNKDGGVQLSGRTVGIIGAGNIGKDLIELLKPFACRILINDILDLSEYAKLNGLELVTKEVLYAQSDIITIHTPFTQHTKNLLNMNVFKQMKPSSFIINTARGGIVNEVDLKTALEDGIITGAALDVYETEPPSDKDFLNLPNLICTPHTGGNSVEAVVAMGMSAIEHLLKYTSNKNNE